MRSVGASAKCGSCLLAIGTRGLQSSLCELERRRVSSIMSFSNGLLVSTAGLFESGLLKTLYIYIKTDNHAGQDATHDYDRRVERAQRV